MSKRYQLKEVILLALIGIIFGVIYYAGDFLYNGLSVVLTPIGLGPMANDITMGLWCMAGPMAAMILRRPAASFLGEFLGATGEMFLGGQWGAANLISGFVQGIASELGFTLTAYKHFDWLGLITSALTSTLITFGWDWFRNGYAHFSLQLNLILIIARFVSMLIFCGVLIKLVSNLLERAHVIKAN